MGMIEKIVSMGEVVGKEDSRGVRELVQAGFGGMDVVEGYWDREEDRVEVPKGLLDGLDGDVAVLRLKGFVGAGKLAGLIGELTPEEVVQWQEAASIALAREIFAIDDKERRREAINALKTVVNGVVGGNAWEILMVGALDFLTERFGVDVKEVGEESDGREIVKRLIERSGNKYMGRFKEFGLIKEYGELTEVGLKGVKLFLERKGLRPMLERELRREWLVHGWAIAFSLLAATELLSMALQAETLLEATLAFQHVDVPHEAAMVLRVIDGVVAVAILGTALRVDHSSAEKRRLLREMLERF